MAELCTRIRVRRQELGMTTEELAQRLGYRDKSSISKIENGKADIPQARVAEFAAALHTTVAWLMGIAEAPPAEAQRQTGRQIAEAFAALPQQQPELEALLRDYMALSPLRRKQVREYIALQKLAETTAPELSI